MRDLLTRMHEWMSRYMKSFYSDDAEVQRGILSALSCARKGSNTR